MATASPTTVTIKNIHFNSPGGASGRGSSMFPIDIRQLKLLNSEQ